PRLVEGCVVERAALVDEIAVRVTLGRPDAYRSVAAPHGRVDRVDENAFFAKPGVLSDPLAGFDDVRRGGSGRDDDGLEVARPLERREGGCHFAGARQAGELRRIEPAQLPFLPCEEM